MVLSRAGVSISPRGKVCTPHEPGYAGAARWTDIFELLPRFFWVAPRSPVVAATAVDGPPGEFARDE